MQGFLAAQGLHGLQGFLAAQGLHGAQAANRIGLQGLHGLAAAAGMAIAAEATVATAAAVSTFFIMIVVSRNQVRVFTSDYCAEMARYCAGPIPTRC